MAKATSCTTEANELLSNEFREKLEGLATDPLGVYKASLHRIREDFGTEEKELAGGYASRQITELIQNGADAIAEQFHENPESPQNDARIEVFLTRNFLYVGNTGAPLSGEGLKSLLTAHTSPKRSNYEIGRFGLGFKSLLRLGGKIEIYSKTNGNIFFDPSRCKQEICQQFNVQEAAGLRLAWPLENPEVYDSCMNDIREWSETLIRAELKSAGCFDALKKEMREFAAEFLLFLPVSVRIVFRDFADGANAVPPRELSVEIESASKKRLSDGGKEPLLWHCFDDKVQITEGEAREDATHIHGRNTVQIAWAYPAEDRFQQISGKFWAFFPTQSPSHVAGILNAPWKVNSDRTALVAGAWNKALFNEAVGLIADAMPRVVRENDPGSVLAAFPRQVDQNDLAKPLIDSLWDKIIATESIPDGNGKLRFPKDLFLPPFPDEDNILTSWNELAGEAEKGYYPHPGCFAKRDRISRLKECAQRLDNNTADNNLKKTGFKTWLEQIAKPEVEHAKKVLRLAEECMKKMTGEEWYEIKALLKIIPSADGRLLSAGEALLATGDIPTDRILILPELADDAEIRSILLTLGVKEPDDNLWRETLARLLPGDANGDWEQFWKNLRMCPPAVSEAFVRTLVNGKILLKRNDDKWVLPTEALLPGGWVCADDDVNGKWLVNAAFHGNDSDILRKLGVRDKYDGITQLSATDLRLIDWRKSTGFSEPVSRPSDIKVIPERENVKFNCPFPVLWLRRLKSYANCRATSSALLMLTKNIADRNYYPETKNIEYIRYGPWGGKYKEFITLENPIFWLLRTKGLLSVAGREIPMSVIASRKDRDGIKFFPDWENIHIVFERLAASEDDVTPQHLKTLWNGIIERTVNRDNVFDPELSVLWRDAAIDGVIPERLPAGDDANDVPISEITVTFSSKLAEIARRNDIRVIILDEPTFKKWRIAGANDLSTEIRVETQGVGEQVDVRDVIPELRPILPDDDRFFPCRLAEEIRQSVKGKSENLPCLAENGELLIARSLGESALKDRLNAVIPEMIGLGWCNGAPEYLLEKIISSTVADARQKVRGEDDATPPERLLRAVGAESLRKQLSDHIGAGLPDGVDDMAFAKLALAQYGVAVLDVFEKALDASGLKPPKRWNTDEARRFVSEIGFPVEYAASAQQKREAEESISGPLHLPPLHDFQEEVMDSIRELIQRDKFRRRAVVSLPTGGGKTRVTVQAAVEFVLKKGDGVRSVLWIAQTDELCEQAVQAFRQVWVNRGAEGVDLRIVRLWGGQSNPEPQSSDKPVVVVASIQTMNFRFVKLDWLSSPGLVVIDECHHAITKSYTNMLRWLDAEAPKPKEEPKEEPAIIGLSATPFRTDEDEKERLAKRFDNTWFPREQEALYEDLLNKKVLSEIKTEALDSGVKWTPEEIELLKEHLDKDEPDWLAVVNALRPIEDRLATIDERNNLIVERIEKALQKGEANSILLFANSIMHARKLSLLLNHRDIPAASIDSGGARDDGTPYVARRDFLDKFKKGEIKVLCNHSILTTGFDAPQTDMIFISRTIFSPVSYMQIVGRGLRGPENGGTSECLIVTLKDNIGRFSDKLAYHYCEKYFTEMKRTVR